MAESWHGGQRSRSREPHRDGDADPCDAHHVAGHRDDAQIAAPAGHDAAERRVLHDIAGHGRIGLHICYDLTYPEVVRTLVLKGAELVINSSATVCGMETYVQHAMYTRAVENSTCTSANCCVADACAGCESMATSVSRATGTVVD